MSMPVSLAEALGIPKPKPEPISREHAKLLFSAARQFVDATSVTTRRQIELVVAMHHFGSRAAQKFAEDRLEQEISANTVALSGVIDMLNNRAEGQLSIVHADQGQSRPVMGVGYDTQQQSYNALVGMTASGMALWPLVNGDQLQFEQ